MKRFICAVLALFATILPAMATDSDTIALTPGKIPTYVCSTPFFTPAAAATALLDFSGAASRKVKVLRIFAVYTATTIGQSKLGVTKRSTLSTGGTAVTVAPVGYNSLQPQTSLAVCRYYTANPGALGTSVGQIRSVSLTTQGVDATPQSDDGYKLIYENSLEDGPLQLNSAAENITIDAGGVIPGGTAPLVSFTVEYTEE